MQKSHPLWVRGLKSINSKNITLNLIVAPFMGAWIEIGSPNNINAVDLVAPFMGAWIEINGIGGNVVISSVAPFMGAWIEIGSGVPI